MKNYWITSGFYSLLNQVTQMIFNLGSVVLLWRMLGKDVCSIWVIYLTITSVVEVSRTGLLQNALMTFLNTTPEEEHSAINTASMLMNVLLSLLIAGLLLFSCTAVADFYNEPILIQLLSIYAITTIILSAVYQFNFIQQAYMDFKGLFWSTFVRTGAMFFYILYLKLTHKSVELSELACIQLLAAIPAAFVGYWFARKYFVLSRKLDFGWLKKLFQYGKYTFGTNVATMAFKTVDKLILGKLLLGSLSTYDLSTKINTLADVPTTTLAAVLFPQSARRHHEDGKSSAKYLYEKSVGVLLSLIIPVVIFILFAADIIVRVIGSNAYADAAPVLRLTIFYGVFMAFGVQFGTVIDSIGKPKLNFYITALGACVNLVCNYFFIRMFGLFGAAYGTLTALSIMFVIMQTILHRVLNVQLIQVFRYALSFYGELYRKFFRKSLSFEPSAISYQHTTQDVDR